MKKTAFAAGAAIIICAAVLLAYGALAPEHLKPSIPEIPDASELPLGETSPNEAQERPLSPEDPGETPETPKPLPGAVVIEGIRAELLEYRGDKYIDASGLHGVLDSGLFERSLVRTASRELLPLEVTDLVDGARLYDSEESTLYITPSAALGDMEPGVNVPIFMYHALAEEPWGVPELFVRPGNFEEQLKYLADNGFETIWFTDLTHLEDYEKPVMLTFDDGYEDNYTVLLPLLEKYGMKATVFVIGSLVGTEHYMTAEQVREMADSGLVSIQSHTWSHRYLDELDDEELRQELERSRLELTRMTGRVPVAVCYPSGRSDRQARETVAEYYQYGVRARGNMYSTDDGRYNMNRYGFARDDTFKYFTRSVSGAGR